MNIDTIFFDAYGTLIDMGDYFHDLSGRILEEAECDQDPYQFLSTWNEEFSNIMFDVIEEERSFLNIRAIYRLSLKNALLKYSIPISETRLDELNAICKQMLDQKCTISRSSRDVIKTLKKDGIKIGLISNGDQKELLQHLRDVSGFFDGMCISENLKLYKPDSRIFRTAMRMLKTKPENSLFVGDSIKIDVYGANRAGIRSVWYNKDGTLPEDGIKPHFTITDIHEVLEISNLLTHTPGVQSCKK